MSRLYVASGTTTCRERRHVARAIDVDHRVVIAAYDFLEQQGLLVFEGVGRRRRIELSQDRTIPVLKFNPLPYEDSDRQLFYLVDL